MVLGRGKRAFRGKLVVKLRKFLSIGDKLSMAAKLSTGRDIKCFSKRFQEASEKGSCAAPRQRVRLAG